MVAGSDSMMEPTMTTRPTGSNSELSSFSGSPGHGQSESTLRGSSKRKISLNRGSYLDVGTLKEVMFAAVSAAQELQAFADAEPPRATVFRALKYGLCVYNVRFVMAWLPFTMTPFTREVVRIGGAERVYLLVTMARFDINRDGQISHEEYAMSRIAGEKCVSNAIAGCANFAIISALLFGASHALTMGRPKPFAPDPKTIEEYGEDATTVAIWFAYGLNVIAQSLALGIIVTSIYIRQLLANTWLVVYHTSAVAPGGPQLCS